MDSDLTKYSGKRALGPKPKGKKSGRHSPQFDLCTELYRIAGIDWAQANGMDVVTAQTVSLNAAPTRAPSPARSSSPVGWDWSLPTSRAVAKS
jgi:hypothetical protein